MERMTFGKHKDKLLSDVPASYLLWVFDQDWITKFPDLEEYVAENYEDIEARKQEEKYRRD